MKAFLGNEAIVTVGEATLLESHSEENSFGAVFEDDGETGYFYAMDHHAEPPIVDALHIYNVASVSDRHIPSSFKIVWSVDGLKTALTINDYIHAVFDFESKNGFCRTGFPPTLNNWSSRGHEWSDEAYDLFRG